MYILAQMYILAYVHSGAGLGGVIVHRARKCEARRNVHKIVLCTFGAQMYIEWHVHLLSPLTCVDHERTLLDRHHDNITDHGMIPRHGLS